MSKLESAVLGVFIAVLVPLMLFFAGWWVSFLVVASEDAIKYTALGCLAAGVLLDLVFLRRLTRRAYTFNAFVLVAAYCFLSLIVFAMFMGMPAFNVLLGALAGLYVGRRIRHDQIGRESANSAMQRTAYFTTCVIAAICLLSASVALLSQSTASDLQSIFHFHSPIRLPILFAVIVAGAAVLIAVEYQLTLRTARFAYQAGGSRH